MFFLKIQKQTKDSGLQHDDIQLMTWNREVGSAFIDILARAKFSILSQL